MPLCNTLHSGLILSVIDLFLNPDYTQDNLPIPKKEFFSFKSQHQHELILYSFKSKIII